MNEQINPAINLNKEAVKYSIVLAMLSIGSYLLAYLINPQILIKWWFGILFLILFIVALIFISRGLRKSNGGFITFGKLFQSLFIAMIISSIISTGFNLLLYKVIDPELETTLRTAMIESTTEMLQGFGMSDDDIEKATSKMQEQSFSPDGKQFAGIIIFSLIISLIFAAVYKKKDRTTDFESMLDDGSKTS